MGLKPFDNNYFWLVELLFETVLIGFVDLGRREYLNVSVQLV